MKLSISTPTVFTAFALALVLALVACGVRDGKPCRHPNDLERAVDALNAANQAVIRDCAGAGVTSQACRQARRARDVAARAVENLRKLPLCES